MSNCFSQTHLPHSRRFMIAFYGLWFLNLEIKHGLAECRGRTMRDGTEASLSEKRHHSEENLYTIFSEELWHASHRWPLRSHSVSHSLCYKSSSRRLVRWDNPVSRPALDASSSLLTLYYLNLLTYLLGMTHRMGESWDELYDALCWIGYAPLKGRWRTQSLRPSPGRRLLPFYFLLFFLVFSILYSNEIKRVFHSWIHFKYLRLSISIHLVIRFD